MRFEKGQWVAVRRATGDCQLDSEARHQVQEVTDSLVKLEGERGWWAHDRFELSKNQLGPGDRVIVVRAHWATRMSRETSLPVGELVTIKNVMGNTVSLVERPRTDLGEPWYTYDRFAKVVPEPVESTEPVPLSDAVRELAQALVDTRERLGESTMPAEEGWAWYDALKKHAPDLLPKGRCLAVLKRGNRVGHRDGGWWIRCSKDSQHDSRHRSALTEWGDGAIDATYLVEGTDD